jgi:hemerythrin superfamily protein
MKTLYDYLAKDHDRLDDMLRRATQNSSEIDTELYLKFRHGLLRHIGIEEKVVFPAIASLSDREKSAITNRLRLDHGALVALLVPTPNPEIIRTLLSILEVHNNLEEKEDGIYHLLDSLNSDETAALLEKIENYPEVPMNPFNDKPGVMSVARRAVERAGYKPLF